MGIFPLLIIPGWKTLFIVKYLNKEVARFDQALNNLEQQIAIFQEHKKIIISEVVTAKIEASYYGNKKYRAEFAAHQRVYQIG